ncbi:glycerol-3-phosphate 1-O-acyltransferase PlsY [Sulfitobacter aestuariivivens]|uniref:Glycerol-3-phosphate acyltransferase n=1 Tax=Sulfitobacter aestuariivivens TaxID=2766981 RepID=A0A927HFH7_9RHOB|nr:glycerol-3-phosphate 1-O-acyltransferase PlsY [Sulfitobacter aestuariivivens]MBD3664448.1 glycerol-3-phosphate 1-O-acyltransferase PlsY [Sulfitobacter aestuariivivens]
MPLIESSAAALLLWASLGYLLGSIPFGMVLARVMNLGNLREIGSGNIGATNVLRTGNKTAAALTLLLDAGKGALAVLLARAFAGEDAAQLAAVTAMLGHCYPVWLGFKGGKGVATFLGIMLAYAWPVGLACCAAWLVAALSTRTSSMGAIAAAAFCTMFLLLFGFGTALIMGIILTVLVMWRHRANITRIRAGTEPRIGQKG